MELKPREEVITLDYPVQLADRLLTEVTVKRPSMKILRTHRVKGDQDVDGEMKLFCALTGLRMEEMEEMDAADYARIQETYVRFRTPAKRGNDSTDGSQPEQADTLEP